MRPRPPARPPARPPPRCLALPGLSCRAFPRRLLSGEERSSQNSVCSHGGLPPSSPLLPLPRPPSSSSSVLDLFQRSARSVPFSSPPPLPVPSPSVCAPRGERGAEGRGGGRATTPILSFPFQKKGNPFFSCPDPQPTHTHTPPLPFVFAPPPLPASPLASAPEPWVLLFRRELHYQVPLRPPLSPSFTLPSPPSSFVPSRPAGHPQAPTEEDRG